MVARNDVNRECREFFHEFLELIHQRQLGILVEKIPGNNQMFNAARVRSLEYLLQGTVPFWALLPEVGIGCYGNFHVVLVDGQVAG